MSLRTAWRTGCRLAVLLPALTLPPGAHASDKQTLGWVETLRLEPWGLLLKAKLDTGAKTAALHATNIRRFERNGEPWVRFDLSARHRDSTAEPLSVERPLAREVTIKLRGTPKNDARPSVHLEFCLSGKRYDALFTLVNRAKFNYPVLLGRRFLADLAVIDPAARFTTEPVCPSP